MREGTVPGVPPKRSDSDVGGMLRWGVGHGCHPFASHRTRTKIIDNGRSDAVPRVPHRTFVGMRSKGGDLGTETVLKKDVVRGHPERPVRSVQKV